VSTTRSKSLRHHLGAVLSKEILSKTSRESFLFESEHQLCRRFGVSRVTIRLVLGDLEQRGLIYRKHGKGTFAHGAGSRPTKLVAVLLKTTPQSGQWPILEMIRGIQNILSPLRISMLVVNTPPSEWWPEMTANLAGVIVFPTGVNQSDLDDLTNRKLPFILAGESSGLKGPRVRLGQIETARAIVQGLLEQGHRRIALLSGFEPTLDDAKRTGIYQALRTARIEPASIPEFSATLSGSAEEAVRSLLTSDPLPTAVVALDDTLAACLSLRIKQNEGLQLADNFVIKSFHASPYLRFMEPALSSESFDFVGAGRAAAEALNRAVLTGNPVENVDVRFMPKLDAVIVNAGVAVF